MKKMKYLLVILPLFMAVTSFAQGKVEMVSSKQTFSQTETTSTTLFTFTGTEDEANALRTKAAELKTRLTLKMDMNASGTYACELHVKTQHHAEYVAKMFLTLGFEKVTVDGVEKPVADLGADLAAMNK